MTQFRFFHNEWIHLTIQILYRILSLAGASEKGTDLEIEQIVLLFGRDLLLQLESARLVPGLSACAAAVRRLSLER